MNINDLTIGQAKELAAMFAGSPPASQSHSIPNGKAVIIRTVTNYYTGRITAVTDYDIVLEDAAWIADTGRWADALKTGKLNEVEPFADPVIVPRGGVIDITIWRHALPRDQK